MSGYESPGVAAQRGQEPGNGGRRTASKPRFSDHRSAALGGREEPMDLGLSHLGGVLSRASFTQDELRTVGILTTRGWNAIKQPLRGRRSALATREKARENAAIALHADATILKTFTTQDPTLADDRLIVSDDARQLNSRGFSSPRRAGAVAAMPFPRRRSPWARAAALR
jgi:hypothetical protein